MQADYDILRELRGDIIVNRLKPCQLLHESGLAHTYRVSRSSIRKIIWELAREDLVRIIPQKGAFVSDLTLKDMEEIVEIRMALEPEASRAAAPRLGRSDIVELDAIDRRLDEALSRNDCIPLFDADVRLHRLVFTSAGNIRAQRIVNNMLGQILRTALATDIHGSRLNLAIRDQKQIVRALRRKNSDAAALAVRSHLENEKIALYSSLELDREFEDYLLKSLSAGVLSQAF